MSISIYGIKNCDTMKKAMTWLNDHNIEYTFHDYKKSGLPAQLADEWLTHIELEHLINKRGTTWRKLDDEVKNNLNKTSAKEIMMENTSVIKRPLLNVNGQYHLGFKPEQYQEIFN
ncbi:ArsC family reductase [Pleionea mediterranea]|jgi:Spx/MgsR family transcriptional regulator|uniref:Spx/MgsR family transcriptional regulator n=1 Tax=Pleionea mediterranea TaxID=523701 RepID=A0A316G071_9GAMM|nr:ArsC family reductase [Pleionea mediterranea]PWK54301.1 Spx/MgsR family transcriptional regulator [Pleionea mediterranea]